MKFSLVLSQDAKKDLAKLDKRTLGRLNRRFMVVNPERTLKEKGANENR
ncbi:hypothetical protein [Desulfobacca acetoxidans]|uniref:Uncharacterized protein n=1 Tax=Desulfobacca acetoxidans (strain ATCC 700848 / DSM 11109 / ASRB2) TaxID=880072 RepID=F2NCW8_DESAR|nr:hypothetical protein [Desulfobacca acetoxidans]AEB09542.1 hypothetical protein Desac_1698 [Desulfobacca acetoxidans DSM 11109]